MVRLLSERSAGQDQPACWVWWFLDGSCFKFLRISIANFYQLCLLEDICSLSGRPGSPSDSALLSSTTRDLTLRMIPIAQTQALLCASHQTEKELFTFRLHFSCLVSYTLPRHVLSSAAFHITDIHTCFFLLPQVLFFLTPRPPSVVCSPCSWPNTQFVYSLVCFVFCTMKAALWICPGSRRIRLCLLCSKHLVNIDVTNC